MSFYKYVLRELLNNRRFCFLFILNLSFGLTGFIALDGFKTSINQAIGQKSKSVLGADLGLSARRPLTEEELKLVRSNLTNKDEESSLLEMFSMVAKKGGESRLVQIKAIEENYPFYGKIVLKNKGVADLNAHQALKESSQVWIYPELQSQLGVQIGDQLTIGEADFIINDIVIEDAAAGISTSMAPRIYMNQNQIPRTKLVRQGSVAWMSLVLKLPGRSIEDLDQLKEILFKQIVSPDVRVFTHENVSQQMASLILRLNDFLGLTSLVSLFLAGLGSAFLFRSYFKMRVKQIATLIFLGATRKQAYFYYLLQLLILGFVSGLFALLFSILIVPGLSRITQGLLPFDIEMTLNLSTVFLGLAIGSFGSFILSLPILVNLLNVKPIELVANQIKSNLSFYSILSLLPSLLLFYVLAVWLSQSYKTGSIFVALFLGGCFVLAASSLLIFKLLEKRKYKSLSLMLAIRDLSRNKITTTVCFVSLGLGALLLSLIPQIKSSIDGELEKPEGSRVPSLFMFDIQEEQLDPLKKILKEKGYNLDQFSPMIRSRLSRVNGQVFDKGLGNTSNKISREAESEMRFRNRGFNLSFKDKLDESESITQGVPFSGSYQEAAGLLPEISMEERFADRLGIKLGDVLEFDIESIPVIGKVINFRKVKWSSFQPNFFIQFQSGVLEMAPKTFVATVPNLTSVKKNEIQNLLVKNLPNISIVDISRVVKSISSMIDQMSWALSFMSFLCLFSGFVLIFTIANHQANQRKWDIGLLKSLGANSLLIRLQFFWQFFVMSLLALLIGSSCSLFAGAFISIYIFNNDSHLNYELPIVTVVMGTLLAIIITDLAIRNSIKIKTKDLFKGL